MRRMAVSMTALCLLVGSVGCVHANQLRTQIVWIELGEDQRAEDLLGLRLPIDVWEVERGHVVAVVPETVLRKLGRHGYRSVVLYASLEDYNASIDSGDAPVRAAGINCELSSLCQDLDTLGMLVSEVVLRGQTEIVVGVTDQQLADLVRRGYEVRLLRATLDEYLGEDEE